MDTSTWTVYVSTVFAAISVYIAMISLAIAFISVRQPRRLQELQWKRDVLQRICGYRYRLTPWLVGTDGEPFAALNEATIVYAASPEVTSALKRMHSELFELEEGILARNLAAVIRAMAKAADVRLADLDDHFLEHPFTPTPPRP